MLKNIEKELRKLYINSKFKIVEQNDNIEIFYNDEKLKNNEDFMDKVFEICEKYLDEKDLWRIAILFDYLNEIDSVSNNVDMSMKLSYSYKQNDMDEINYRISKLEEIVYKMEKEIKIISKKVNNINTKPNYILSVNDEKKHTFMYSSEELSSVGNLNNRNMKLYKNNYLS